MIATFAALAEANRFRIVDLLRDGACAVGDIAERLSMQQPQVSKHLRVLKDAGLVDVEARAQQRLYRLRGAPLRELHDWLEDYRSLWDERFAQLDDVIEKLKREDTAKRARSRTSPRKRKDSR